MEAVRVKTSRAIGWLAFGAIVAWLYYDYRAKKRPAEIRLAIVAGWITLALTLAHIGLGMRGK